MSQALYRKYRSKSLAEIVGQAHVTDMLARSLAAGRVAHAYLLTGPRGVGKTSIARILAHEINKLPYTDDATNLDIIEIDAASNNGVEDVRDLRDKVQIAPVAASKKVYIIDEVHMLSKAAFNALLKTLEEPPEHVVFILATTDADKLPATIISRTQRFHFRAITPADAVKHLRYIATEEGIAIDDEALQLIATRGDGAFRDSISLLDQLSSLADEKSGITRQLVEQALGLAPGQLVENLLVAYSAKDLPTTIALLSESEQNGVQPTVLASQIIQAVRAGLAEKPQLLPLLDSLLEVTKSPQPAIKLLVALATHATSKPKTAALAAPTPTITASVAELKSQKPAVATQESSALVSPIRKDVPARASRAPQANLRSPLEQPEEGEKPKREQSQTQSPGHLDWPQLLEYTHQNHVAIHSVLAKCTPETTGGTLKIYTLNPFYKKKLDDAKYRTVLSESLQKTGAGSWDIETIPTPPPPKDSTAAAVAAIMGGGEEVSVAV